MSFAVAEVAEINWSNLEAERDRFMHHLDDGSFASMTLADRLAYANSTPIAKRAEALTARQVGPEAWAAFTRARADAFRAPRRSSLKTQRPDPTMVLDGFAALVESVMPDDPGADQPYFA